MRLQEHSCLHNCEIEEYGTTRTFSRVGHTAKLTKWTSKALSGVVTKMEATDLLEFNRGLSECMGK